MTLSRRKTLALLGGGLIAAAGTGFGVAITRPATAATAPWGAAGGYADPRMQALSYAILAPNPHNRQPWMVDLSTPDEATLYVDTDRLLPHTDPFSRQIVIGLGCFLEVLRLAALEDGLRTEVDLFPQGSDPEALDARPVAVIRFVTDPGAIPDPLFQQVLHRRSLKEPFDTSRPLPADDVAAIVAAASRGSAAGATIDEADVEALRQLSNEALRIELETPHTYKESVDLFRIGRREVIDNPDGIDFTGPLFEAMQLTGLMTREAALDPDGMIFAEGMKAVHANTDTAMGHIWLVTADNSREAQIMAGADWVRTNLKATELGIGFQPLSQALQEYPEMQGLYDDIHERLAPEGGTVQMFVRLGYGPEVAPAPRWALENKIIGTA